MIIFTDGLDPDLWTYCIERNSSTIVRWINYWGA
jgi:hypothetical protein